ncbi:AraC family transcriptional regulator [Saccharibacillus sp. JS10]|uniref:AraC family transcriptional regulator n=1 Tax=Saccharibacillus sp. JS10 TaxID=2950552 RepID=UPI00210ECD34|nr:AraC family transcriptional regulator [Saccharibacillus sp. JS10]MCQ4088629.1 AraC family transcriptional regulator [Saccharibacillus sp. JS10]
MDRRVLLSNYLANLEVELITAHHNLCPLDWRELDYKPDYSKFYWIEEGEGWLRIEGQDYYPKPGELFLMPEGVQQSYSVISERPFLKYWCHFTAQVGGVNLFKLLDLNPYCSPTQPQKVTEIFKDIVYHANTDTIYSKLLVKSKLMELVSYYMMNLNIDEEQISFQNGSTVNRLTHVLDYIDEHIAQNIAVEELAGIAYMHPNSFIRTFKQYAGMPPIQYVTHKKIEKAKQSLSLTSLSVTEISEQLGFNDTFYFSKQFKKYAGLTPTDYRRQQVRS